MTRLEALNELREKVAAGDYDQEERTYSNIETLLVDLGKYNFMRLFLSSWMGDKNAAFALKDAVCPDWGNDLASHGADGWMFMLTKYHSHIRRWAIHDDLAAAILIAVIKALIWEAEQAEPAKGGN